MPTLIKCPIQLWPLGHHFQSYAHIVPPGIPMSAVMTRDFWVHVADRLRPMDVINCIAEDGSFDVTFRLLHKTPTEMKFRTLYGGLIEDAQPIERDTRRDSFVIQSNGRNGGWNIKERSTGKLVAEGLPRQEADTLLKKLETQVQEAA